MKSRTTTIIILGIVAGAAITVACGASKAASSPATPPDNAAASAPQATATAQPVATPTDPPPAPTSTAVAVATPTAAPAAAAPAAPPPPPPPAPAAPPPAPAGSTTVTLDLGDNFFSSKEVTVPAGVPITVTINNQGQALHNWDVTGVVKTGFVQHGQSQTVTFTGAPGTYTFQCDVHPKEMTGVLVVK